MTEIFDTHCHLMSEEYKNDEIEEIIKNAKLSGVNIINNVGYNIDSSLSAVYQALQYKNIYATIGIHPIDIIEHSINDLYKIDELAHIDKVIAIGEIGLDYNNPNISQNLQKEWFIKQIKIAKNHNLPIVIHCRNAYEDCYNILVEQNIKKGVMHCYNGDIENAQKIINLGLYISFSGILTFKNTKNLQMVVKKIPLNKILVETDAPYLTPNPHRGKKNYPKFIIYTIKKIAELKKIPLNEMIIITTKNAYNAFNLNKK